MKSENSTPRQLVICLHGSGTTSHMWQAFRQAARGRCRVLTPQLDGNGVRSLAEDAASVIEQIVCAQEPFHVVAHGRGAAVAASIAQQIPGRVLSVVTYEPAGISRALETGLTMPVRILCGTRSWRAAQQFAGQLAERVASARLLKLVGLRHMAPLTHARVVNSVFLDYLLPMEMPGQAIAA